MKGLLVKDFHFLKLQYKFMIGILFFAVFLQLGQDDISFLISYIIFTCTTLVLSTFNYDEFDQGYPFLFTLPISRTIYVLEKYVLSLIIGTVAWLLSVILGSIFLVLNSANAYFNQWFLPSIILLATSLFMLFIMIPVQIKFGAEKSRIALFGCVGCFLAGCYVFYYLFDDLDVILTRLSNLNPYVAIPAYLFFVLIVMLISIKVSVSILNKKDL